MTSPITPHPLYPLNDIMGESFRLKAGETLKAGNYSVANKSDVTLSVIFEYCTASAASQETCYSLSICQNNETTTTQIFRSNQLALTILSPGLLQGPN